MGCCFALFALVVADCLDDPPVPILLPAFVDHFVEHVIQVVDGVHHFANVGRLEVVYFGVAESMHLGFVRVELQLVDVVGRVKRVGTPGPAVRRGTALVPVHQAPPFEKHHRDVDAALAGGFDARS